MTPADILQEMNDIQLPAELPAASTGLAIWPFLVLGLILAAWAWLSWRRRSFWRRQAKQALGQIDDIADDQTAETALIELRQRLRRLGDAKELPNQVFMAGRPQERRQLLRADIAQRLDP